MKCSELVKHRIEELEHTVGGNGQPGLVQHVNDLRATAAQAKFASQIFPVIFAAIGAFFVYFVLDEIKTLRETGVEHRAEVQLLKFQVDELWHDSHPTPIHQTTTPGEPHVP